MIFIYKKWNNYVYQYQYKKSSMKSLFLGMFALVWFWYQAIKVADESFKINYSYVKP